MRIIGGKDYYDSASQYGIDKTVVFVRRHNEWSALPAKDILRSLFDNILYFRISQDTRFYASHCSTYAIEQVAIMVSGKVWRGIRYNGIEFEKAGSSNYGKLKYFWNIDSYKNFAKEHNIRAFVYGDFHNKEIFENIFSCNEVSKEIIDYLIENQITIVTMILTSQSRNLTIPEINISIDNDNLKDFEFYKIVEPTQMYQMIEQWKTGVLPIKPNTTVDIVDNNIKIAKHGFDKFSFRKPKNNT